MKIYTKTGDKGQTSLYDGTRVDKDNIIINKSFYQARTTSPLLKAKASHEIAWINKVDDHTQGHTALIAWRPDEVRGEVLGKL